MDKKHFRYPEIVLKGISNDDFRNSVYLATKESFPTFDKKNYVQVNGASKGSPLQTC